PMRALTAAASASLEAVAPQSRWKSTTTTRDSFSIAFRRLAVTATGRGPSLARAMVNTGLASRCSRRRFNSATANISKSAAEIATSYLKARFIRVGTEEMEARRQPKQAALQTGKSSSGRSRPPPALGQISPQGGVVARPFGHHLLSVGGALVVPPSFLTVN